MPTRLNPIPPVVRAGIYTRISWDPEGQRAGVERQRRGVDFEHVDSRDTRGATDVSVSSHDMFLEGALHLRGMIRQRRVEGLDTVFTDPEDAVNPHFQAGPPRQMTLDP